MKKILVAIEIARQGGNDAAITTAQNIAKAMGGEIILLHVIEQAPQYVNAQLPKGILVEQLQAAKTGIRELAAQYDCSDAVICEGQPATEILEYASEIKADLIVLQSHDPNITTYFLGSVASRVVRHARCSVHVVRQPESD